jgi:hypothetical protein
MNKRVLKVTAIAAALVSGVSMILGTTACGQGEKTYTMEEKLTARAVQLAKTTLNTYIDDTLYQELVNGDADGELLMYGTYNPWTGEVDGEASVWHYTSVVAMTNRLMSVTSDADKDYFAAYNTNLWKEMDWYKGARTITSYRSEQRRWMYAVNRSTVKDKADISGINAVYDDQMWIIRELISTYQITGDSSYLTTAEELTDTCLDGWDSSINSATGEEYGGITWGPGYASKHTCSNAPLIAPLVELSEIYKNSSETINSQKKSDYYLEWAEKIYDFSYTTFKNTNDLYGDLVGSEFNYNPTTGLKETTSQGTLDISQYTYNTGTMIQGGAKLYAATKNKNYLTEAQNSAEAAYRIFGAIDEETGLSQYPTTSTSWFNFELLLGFVNLAEVDDSQYASANETYIKSFMDELDYAYDHYYYNGMLPRNYLKGWMYGIDFDDEKSVMDCAASAEMYALLSSYYSKKG